MSQHIISAINNGHHTLGGIIACLPEKLEYTPDLIDTLRLVGKDIPMQHYIKFVQIVTSRIPEWHRQFVRGQALGFATAYLDATETFIS